MITPSDRSRSSVLTALALASTYLVIGYVFNKRTLTTSAIGVAEDSAATKRRVAQQDDADTVNDATKGRGRGADSPSGIVARGWFGIARRTIAEFSDDRILAVAAGVTFYALLAIFPGIAALISLYGLFSDPATISGHLDKLSGILPGGASEILGDQMTRLAHQNTSSLGFGFLIGIGAAFWSASAGIKAVFEALNIVYDEKEKRGYLKLSALALLFTLGVVVFLLLALGAIVVLPIALKYLGLEGISQLLVQALKWPLLLIITALAMAVVYAFGPSRARAQWRWISYGSALAAVLWVGGSLLFSWYVQNFGSYNKTYGSLGAVIGFMTWMWLSTTIFLLGAELNSEIEHQTACDTTIGPDRARGNRGAVAADTIGHSFE